MRNISIEIKVIIAIVFFTLFIVSLERYKLSENVTNQFIESKKSKNELLVNTIAPIISLNLFLGLDDTNRRYLDQIVKQNSDLALIKLMDVDGEVIYSSSRNSNNILTKNKNSMNFISKNITSTMNSSILATIELYFSNREYKLFLQKNRETTIEVFSVALILLTLFVLSIKREFRHLKELSKNVLSYDPKLRNITLTKTDRMDEVGVIHNAIVTLEEKIESHTKLLDITNSSLEEKVKQRTEELELAKIKAEESTKLKSNFLANMSHEIRTPINGIIGMTYLVKQTELDDRQLNYLYQIETASNNLLNIINDILDFSKIEAGKLNIIKISFDMNDIIDNIKSLLELKAIEKGLKFNIFYSDSNSNFYGDPLRIEQILINLINNAIKFTNKGSVTLSILYLNNDRVKFSVKDTGIGITAEQQSNLFQSFIQADGSTTRKYGGTGLGLSISKQLVELMNGTIHLESEIDKGSEFIFEIELPRLDEVNIKKSSDNSALNNLEKEMLTLKGSNILLVEDNETNSLLILSLLEASGMKIDSAMNGKIAVEKYKQNQEKYELILMDIQMPVMDGYEATKQIREIDKNIPIIAITANAMEKDRQRSKSVGMDEHISKPIDIKKLYTILLKYISKKVV